MKIISIFEDIIPYEINEKMTDPISEPLESQIQAKINKKERMVYKQFSQIVCPIYKNHILIFPKSENIYFFASF
jgi:hypothetical protein